VAFGLNVNSIMGDSKTIHK